MKLYGKTLFFKRGIYLSIFPSFHCNLNCPYCVLKIPTGEVPKVKESTLSEWKEFIKSFPVKIREIAISGGEPSIVPYFVELVNWLLSEGYHVKIYTNLTSISPFLQLKKSYRLIIKATYHACFGNQYFQKNYRIVKEYHRVDVREFEKQTMPFSKVLKIVSNFEEVNREHFRVRPDRNILIGCYDLIKSEIA